MLQRSRRRPHGVVGAKQRLAAAAAEMEVAVEMEESSEGH